MTRPAPRELSELLPSSIFPADRYELYAQAGRRGATEAVLDALHRLPTGQEFGSVDEVLEMLAGGRDVQSHIMRPERSGPAEASSQP